MPTQCARRVWAPGRARASGTLPPSPGVLSTAAAPSFSELLLPGRRLPLPTAGTRSPTPIPEPAELEPDTRLANTGKGQPGYCAPPSGARPERRRPRPWLGPSSLPALPHPARAALHSCWGRWAGPGGHPAQTSVLQMPHALHCVPVESRGGGSHDCALLTYPIGWGVECV